MEIREITNKEIWENFILGGKESKLSSSPFATARECEEKSFLQSWNWGEFQKMTGNKIWRIGVFENSKLINLALIIKIKAKRGTFLFLPHLVLSEGLQILVNYLKALSREEKADFIRIAPILERSEENIEIFKKLGFREAPIHIHPEITWELDIIPSEEELFRQMRKTTRYLIRQAQKNPEVKIEQSTKLEDIEKFNNLYQETVDRHHFVPFSFDYLKNEFLAFQPNNEISIFFGKYRDEIVSSGIFIFWQNNGFYHHGASSLKHPKIPVSYLLLWEAIKEAKQRGCQKFNFWGISPESQKSHPWYGLTLFKMGFGGYKKEYLKTQDLPLSKKYWLNFLIEKLRKTKRGL
jgi:lipid II:glycine glycyltransferase (peptidoglycan interpeptide bridge formation enzyme)